MKHLGKVLSLLDTRVSMLIYIVLMGARSRFKGLKGKVVCVLGLDVREGPFYNAEDSDVLKATESKLRVRYLETSSCSGEWDDVLRGWD